MNLKQTVSIRLMPCLPQLHNFIKKLRRARIQVFDTTLYDFVIFLPLVLCHRFLSSRLKIPIYGANAGSWESMFFVIQMDVFNGIHLATSSEVNHVTLMNQFVIHSVYRAFLELSSVRKLKFSSYTHRLVVSFGHNSLDCVTIQVSRLLDCTCLQFCSYSFSLEIFTNDAHVNN